MMELYIPKDKLSEFVAHMLGRARVFAPVRQGDCHEFAQLESAAECDLTFQNTRLSAKSLFHPHSERMFQYSLAKGDPEAGILKEAPKDFSPRVVLGIRPCDARALELVKCNFSTSTYKDPWWEGRRDATTIIGLACNAPCGTCFCTTVGCGPFDFSGMDASMVDTGEGYILNAHTDKGEKMLAGVRGEVVVQGLNEKAAELRKAAEGKISNVFDPQALAQKDAMELFNSPFWEEVQFSCINCGTCTYLCPTCWCFDIQDEVCGDKGDRLRTWDSCMFPLFTLHGSGHNPRQNKVQRVRQRFMHKLKYYGDKYGGGVACTGCGRCVRSCPVNIDIRKVAGLMTAGCVCPA